MSGDLAEFVCEARANEGVLEQADHVVLRIVDTIAVALTARALDEGMAGTRRAARSPGSSILWGGAGASAPLAEAVLANGMLTSALEFDDTHTASFAHAGAAVIPVVLGMADELGSTFEDVIRASVVGYEVACRLGRQVVGPLQKRGFHSSVTTVFGAAAAAAYLLELDVAETVNAFGVAGSMSSGITEYLADGTSAKQMHIGWSGQGGVIAAQLAAEGFTGPATVLEGARGVLALFAGVEADPKQLVAELGLSFAIAQVRTKRYPACYAVHPHVDMWFDFARQNEISSQELAARTRTVTCLVQDVSVPVLLEPMADKRAPQTAYGARFSLPFFLASAAVTGSAGVNGLTASGRSNPDALAFAQRIGYERAYDGQDPRLLPSGLKVELDDGSVLFAEREFPEDRDDDAPTMADKTAIVFGKFKAAAGLYPQAGSAPDDFLAAIRDLKASSSVAPLLDALRRI